MIEVTWDNEERKIVLWKFSKGWTWSDFFDAKSEVDRMIDSVEGTVDSIFLTSREKLLPEGAIAQFRRIINSRHERHDLIVLVGSKLGSAPTVLTSVLNVVLKFVPSAQLQLHYVSDINDAYSLIEAAQQRRLH